MPNIGEKKYKKRNWKNEEQGNNSRSCRPNTVRRSTFHAQGYCLEVYALIVVVGFCTKHSLTQFEISPLGNFFVWRVTKVNG